MPSQSEPLPEEHDLEVTAETLFEEHDNMDICRREEIAVESFPYMTAITAEDDIMKQSESCQLERQTAEFEKDDLDNTHSVSSPGNPLLADIYNYYIVLYSFLFHKKYYSKSYFFLVLYLLFSQHVGK